MVVFESRRIRRLVGRIERGEELPAAFEHLAHDYGVDAGWIRALGAFEWVELCEYDQQAQRYRPAQRIDVPTEILTLEGNLSLRDGRPFVHLHATVSHEVDETMRVLGGHLVGGRVFACEFVIESYDDLELRREPDEPTGLSLWAPPDEGEEGLDAPSPDAAPSWAQVAAVSTHVQEQTSGPGRGARAGKRTRPLRRPSAAKEPSAPVVRPDPLPERPRAGADYLDEPYPERGDWVDHTHFGRCRVDGEDPDGGLIIRLPSGVRKTIRLDYLQVQPPRHEGDERIFGLRPRRRG